MMRLFSTYYSPQVLYNFSNIVVNETGHLLALFRKRCCNIMAVNSKFKFNKVETQL